MVTHLFFSADLQPTCCCINYFLPNPHYSITSLALCIKESVKEKPVGKICNKAKKHHHQWTVLSIWASFTFLWASPVKPKHPYTLGINFFIIMRFLQCFLCHVLNSEFFLFIDLESWESIKGIASHPFDYCCVSNFQFSNRDSCWKHY